MDPAWQDEPPPQTEFAGIRLIRTPPGRELVGVITSDHITGCPTHYVHRRTTPCTGTSCTHCLDGLQPRWHGYLSIRSMYSETQYVLELTALAAAPIQEYLRRHGTLRGARLHAKRVGDKPNSPVQTTVSPNDTDLRTLAPEVHMRRYLATLWSLTNNGQPHSTKGADQLNNPPETVSYVRSECTFSAPPKPPEQPAA